jgi:predicted nucleotide-binding protein
MVFWKGKIVESQPGGSRTLVEKLEKYSDVDFAFILLTPDDVGCQSRSGDVSWIIPHLAQKTDLQISPFLLQTFKPRARQNVVLEFGYFIGKLNRDRVCCLLKGNVEKPSDMGGIVYVPFMDSVEEVRATIMKELKAAGFDVKKI